MFTTIRVMNLKATYGGWVLYRDGELFARSWESKKDALAWAKRFCEQNGLQMVVDSSR